MSPDRTAEPSDPSGDRRSKTRWIAFLVVTTLATSQGALAHKHPCSHTHQSKFLITCNVRDAACTQNGKPGMCKTIQYRNRLNCECRPKKGEEEESGGCLSAVTYAFSDQGDGPPAANTPFIYLAQSDPENLVSVNNGGLLGPEFGPEDNAIEGTIELFFGSFAEPTAVPVIVEGIFLSLPSVFGSGPHFVELPEGAPQPLIYNHFTGVLDTVDNAGLLVQVTNDWGTEVVPLHLSAELTATGFQVFAQASSSTLTFQDGFESGDTSRWSVFTALVNLYRKVKDLTGWSAAPASDSPTLTATGSAGPAPSCEPG